MHRPRLIVIVGPTASGKSALAVRLAEIFNGEVVSADSRQIYRGLDVGTGKIRRREMWGIPHHLLDVADPRRAFSVAEFQHLADRAIRGIVRRGRIPFLVGGTAFWIDTLAYGLSLPAVPPNPNLRARLVAKTPDQLYALLAGLDPKRADTVDPKNSRRLIRAIEIAAVIGRTPAIRRRNPYSLLWIGIKPSEQKLRRLIRERLARRMRAGMVREARRLRRRGLTWKRFYELGLEYRFLADYLRRKTSRDEMEERLAGAIDEYARRQMRWWRRNHAIHWIEDSGRAEQIVGRFLRPAGRPVLTARRMRQNSQASPRGIRRTLPLQPRRGSAVPGARPPPPRRGS